MDLPLPPSRFVVVPTRITRDQRKAEKKTKSEGPKIQESKGGSTQKNDTQITSERTRRKRNTKYQRLESLQWLGRRMTRPEEDVEIGATASPAVGALGATSDVFDVATIGEVVGAREEDEVLSTE